MQKKHIHLRQEALLLSQGQVPIRPTYVWDRIAAFVVDLLVILLLGNLASAPFKRKLEESILLNNDGSIFLQLIAISIIYAVLFILYHTLSVYFYKTTLGKRIFKIEVRSIWEKGQLTFSICFFRAILQLMSLGAFAMPFIGLFYDFHRRVFHEKVTETYTHSASRYSPFPVQKEKLWVYSFYTIILAHICLFGMIQYKTLSKKYSYLSELLTFPEYLCEEVSYSKDRWSRIDESRLDIALTLYNSNMVGEDCLEVEAQRALSFDEELGKAYFALGLINKMAGDVSLADQYTDQICKVDETGEACWLYRMLNAFSLQSYDEAHRILGSWGQENSTYAKVMILRQYYFEKQYSKAQGLIEDLWDVAPIKNFLSMYRTLIHYEKDNLEKAQEAFVLTYPDLDYDHQKLFSAVVCEKEVENGCSIEQTGSCWKLENNISESNFQEVSDKEFVSYLKYTYCPDVNIQEALKTLGEKVETMEQATMIGAVRANQKGRYEVEKELLEQVLKESERDSEITYFARSMLIKRTYDDEGLISFVKSWEALSPYHPHYFSFGMQIFDQLVKLKKYDLAYQVEQFIGMSYPNHPKYQMAQKRLEHLKNGGGEGVQLRLPASARDNKP